MARVYLYPSQGMKLPRKPNGNYSDDEDGVQSGSATGFSDGEEIIAHARPAKVINTAFDPVNRILDKIDAELSSLTYSQGSSSTATDSTVVLRTPSHESTNTSRLDSGSLTISQLGPSSHKPSFSPLNSGSKHSNTSDRDTGIGTGASSFRDSHHRSRSEQEPVRALEPGEIFKAAGFGPPHRSNSPDLAILHGHHGQSDDDKSKRENMTSSPFAAKQLDDRFKEIMQKRKGGFLGRASTDDDNQTIRTEDFADKFQDALIYPSSDEAERLRNIEEDLHSDGGSDTDTLQRKLVSLTQPRLRKSTDGRVSPRPMPRPQRKLGPQPEIRPRKVGGPGTPPVYPKPTPTNTLPRPSTRSSIKFTPGHTSDADSVRTEDFEHQFKDLMVIQGNQPPDSDADTVSNDPIHTRVKELLKATAKYKPKIEPKPKQHVRISSKPPQYQDQNEGEESDDTLCSEKDGRVTSSRTANFIQDLWEPNRSSSREPTILRAYENQPICTKTRPLYASNSSLFQKYLPTLSSFEESSKSSTSLSQSSLNSNDKERTSRQQNELKYDRETDTLENVGNIAAKYWSRLCTDQNSNISNKSLSVNDKFSSDGNEANFDRDRFVTDRERQTSDTVRIEKYPYDLGFRQGCEFKRQASQISSASSAFSSTSSTFSSTSEYTERSVQSYPAITSESYFGASSDCTRSPAFEQRFQGQMSYAGATRRRSHEFIAVAPYDRKTFCNDHSMKKDKQNTRKQRDLIIQDDEEEEYPFAKYTFNKKPTKLDDSSSSMSNSSRFSSSRGSIYSISLLKQYNHMKNGRSITSRSSDTSLLSSLASSLTDSPDSFDDLASSTNMGSASWRNEPLHSQNSNPGLLNPSRGINCVRNQQPSSASHCEMVQYGTNSVHTNGTENLLNYFGLDEARSILPERFIKSWVDKVKFNQKKEIDQRLMNSNQENGQLYMNPELYYVDDSDFLPPSVSAQQSGTSTPGWQSSLENIYTGNYTYDQRIGQRVCPRMKFRRSKTFNSSFNSSIGFTDKEMIDSEYSKLGALPLCKENSFDRLKQILQSSDPLVTYRERDVKRNRFASNRQNSLPIFLETLSEEEEEKNQLRKNKHHHKKRGDIISNMKSFLDEEDENMLNRNGSLSSTEYDQPIKTEVGPTVEAGSSSRTIVCSRDKIYRPIRNSISSSDDTGMSDYIGKCCSTNDNEICDGSLRSVNSSLSDTGLGDSGLAKHETQSAENKMPLPSIFVSENEVFKHETRMMNGVMKDSSNKKCLPDRPMSPNPDSQVQTNLDDAFLRSKDSLEVAEIMSLSNKFNFTSNKLNISQHDKVRPIEGEPPIAHLRKIEKRNSSGSSSSRFLSIEQDDKYLSPASSSASPLIMSPITVIELKKLDNQNDSLELEDNKDSDSNNTNSIEKHHQQGEGQITVLHNQSGVCSNNDVKTYAKPRKVVGQPSIPNELSLERRCYANEPKLDDDAESDDVFTAINQRSKSLETMEMFVQADSDTLTPLFKFSEVNQMIQNMCSKLHCKIGEGLFYMAQDKGVQCDMIENKAPVNYNNDQKHIFERNSATEGNTNHCLGTNRDNMFFSEKDKVKDKCTDTIERPLHNHSDILLDTYRARASVNTHDRPLDNVRDISLDNAIDRHLDNHIDRPLGNHIDKSLDNTIDIHIANHIGRPIDNASDILLVNAIDRPIDNDYARHLTNAIDRPLVNHIDIALDIASDITLDNDCDRPLDNYYGRPLCNDINRPLDNHIDRPLDDASDRPLDNAGDTPLDNASDRPLANDFDRHVYSHFDSALYYHIDRYLDSHIDRSSSNIIDRHSDNHTDRALDNDIDIPVENDIDRLLDNHIDMNSDNLIGMDSNNHIGMDSDNLIGIDSDNHIGMDSDNLIGIDSDNHIGMDSDNLIGMDSDNLIGMDSNNHIGMDSDNLIGMDSNNVIGMDSNNHIGMDSDNLIGMDSNNVIGMDSNNHIGMDSDNLIGIDSDNHIDMNSDNLIGMDSNNHIGMDSDNHICMDSDNHIDMNSDNLIGMDSDNHICMDSDTHIDMNLDKLIGMDLDNHICMDSDNHIDMDLDIYIGIIITKEKEKLLSMSKIDKETDCSVVQHKTKDYDLTYQNSSKHVTSEIKNDDDTVRGENIGKCTKKTNRFKTEVLHSVGADLYGNRRKVYRLETDEDVFKTKLEITHDISSYMGTYDKFHTHLSSVDHVPVFCAAMNHSEKVVYEVSEREIEELVNVDDEEGHKKKLKITICRQGQATNGGRIETRQGTINMNDRTIKDIEKISDKVKTLPSTKDSDLNVEKMVGPDSNTTKCLKTPINESTKVNMVLNSGAAQRKVCSVFVHGWTGECINNFSPDFKPTTQNTLSNYHKKQIPPKTKIFENSTSFERNGGVYKKLEFPAKGQRDLNEPQVLMKEATDTLDDINNIANVGEEINYKTTERELSIHHGHVNGQTDCNRTKGCSRNTFSSTKEIVLCFSDTRKRLTETSHAQGLCISGIRADNQDNNSSISRNVIKESKAAEQVVDYEQQNVSDKRISQVTSLERNSQLSSRSLDFDSLGTRKNILMRSHETTFSKSFDGPTEDEGEIKNCLNIVNAVMFKDCSLDCSSGASHTLKVLVKDVLKLNRNNIDKTRDNSGIYDTYEWVHHDNTEQNSLYTEGSTCDEMFNQREVNYNDGLNVNVDHDNSVGHESYMMDVRDDVTDFERISVFVKEDSLNCSSVNIQEISECKINLYDITGEHDHNRSIHNPNQFISEQNQNLKTLQCQKFVICERHQHHSQTDDDNYKTRKGHSQRNHHHDKIELKQSHDPIKTDYEIDTSDFSDALEELDKMYRLENNKLIEKKPVAGSCDQTGKTNNYKYNLETFMEEVEDEVDHIKIYTTELNNKQTHCCKNCGHSAEYEATSHCHVKTSQVEHDYCSHCSPLQISTEVLERHRLDKKNS